MKIDLFPTFILFILLTNPLRLLSAEDVSIIPFPAKISIGNEQFYLTGKTQLIVEDDNSFFYEVCYLQNFIKSVTGSYLSSEGGNNKIIIRTCDDCEKASSYKLDITSKDIIISAGSTTGVFYAIQTLRQLILAGNKAGIISIPALSVYDYPAYEWRGMMLDVSRHFFSIGYLKRQIDLLAHFKFNKLHLHLTDDQGWRIEIKQYPELTQKGAWRTFNKHDSLSLQKTKENPDFELDPNFLVRNEETVLYGGFYTQEEIRDLVKYAQERHIEIIPEIDMPGHMMAAINAYPELSCTGKAAWGELFSVPLCPCNEAVYTFLEHVLDEVISLFPSKYIHIGADEVEKNTWEESQACKELMQARGLDNSDKLQSYFVERMQKYLTSKGKETIGWDEVLDGGINPEINIMYWRDWIGSVPEKAVDNGNKLIFSPGYPLYLSRPDSSIYDVYHMKELKLIPEDKRSLVLGAQANIWAEQITSVDRANYLIYPRLIALSEIVWTPESNQNWGGFKSRLNSQLAYLDKLGIKHSLLPYTLILNMIVDTVKKEILFSFDSERIHPDIYYTTDGTIPTLQSQKYTGTISVSDSAVICAAIYADGKMQEPVFKRSADYHKAIGKKVLYLHEWHPSYPANKEKTLTDGLRGGLRYNDGYWQGFTSDIEVVIDMDDLTELTGFSATFMQITGPGVYMPEYVEVSLSDDGKTFEEVLHISNDVSKDEKELTFKTFRGSLKTKKARYVKVFAKHNSGFLFLDEVVIN